MSAGDGGIGTDVGQCLGDGVIGWLEEENVTFLREEFAVAIAAPGSLGKGIETAFGAINDGETDVHTSFDQLGGDKDDGQAIFPKTFGAGEDQHDVPRAHPGREMECVCVEIEFFVKSLGGFGGIEDEEAAGGGMFKNVSDEMIVVDGTEIFAFDAIKDDKKSGLVTDNRGDFFGWDANGEVGAAFERGLGGGAKDSGGVQVVDETAESTEDGMEEPGGQGLNFIEDDDTASDAMELSAGTGTIGVKRLEKLDVGGDDERSVPVFCREAVAFGLVLGVEFGVVFEDDVATKLFCERGEDITKNVGVLFDDASERNDKNDATMSIFECVAKGKKQG